MIGRPLTLPSFLEDHVSQIPALQLLQNLGYVYLRREEVHLERGGKLSNALLEGVQVCSQETQGASEVLPTPTPLGTVIP